LAARVLAVAAAWLCAIGALQSGAARAADAIDCTGPAGDPPAGSAAWAQREQENDWCGEQRAYDTSGNPLYVAANTAQEIEHGGQTHEDAFRDPATWNGTRGRYQPIAFTTKSGQRLAGALFRPPATVAPPYPGVVIVHGGAANQEMYLWGSEGLAEAGYMVMTFQIPEPDNAESSFHYPDSKDALDWFESTPANKTAAGESNPLWAELDHAHVGLAGHSAGGVAVSRLGQEDPRVSAIVSWDRAQSSAMPPGLEMRTPALFLVADFNCQKVPVCVPQPYPSPPDPKGPGNKDEDFRRVRAAGVDTMKVALRAATHLDFTQFGTGTGSRYGAAVAFYYTLAWFDRYLKGDRAADGRLTATDFDRSGDVHNISGGTFDPATQSNVPAYLNRLPVRDRLSFHFRSAYFLEGGRFRCEDVRAGCPPPAAQAVQGVRRGSCTRRRRFVIHVSGFRGARVLRVRAIRGGHVVGRGHSRRVVVHLSRAPARATALRLEITLSTRRGRREVAVVRRYRLCHARANSRISDG
jgi:dienelactone hydrolase